QIIYFFFFQAEDGIRDRNVTGVQTCALPIYNQVLTEIKNKLISIYSKERLSMNEKKFKHGLTEDVEDALKSAAYDFYVNEIKVRSEERRVGKEYRCQRWEKE